MATARLATIDLPDFGMPDAAPELPASLYPARLERLRERAEARGYDRLVVYADREHSAGMAWLSGFDPRFEEAIVVVGPTGDPAILVGNECYGMAGAAPLPMRRELFQDLSLPGQPRDRSRGLAEVLADEALRAALATAYPGAWARIEARRRFMAEALGIALHPDVLPFSNIPAWLPPFLLRPDRALTLAG